MQTKRIFSAFAFTLLTILLLLVVASRTSEAAQADGSTIIDANLGAAMPSPTAQAVMPGGKEDTQTTMEEKPDIDISSWEYIIAGPDNNIGTYTPPQVVAIENTAQYFDERAITPLVDFLNAARAAGYSPYIMTAYRSYSTQEYILNGRASQIAWPEYPTAEDYAEAEQYVAPPGGERPSDRPGSGYHRPLLQHDGRQPDGSELPDLAAGELCRLRVHPALPLGQIRHNRAG